MKKICAICVLFLYMIFHYNCYAQSDCKFELSPVLDCSIICAGLTLNALSLIFSPDYNKPDCHKYDKNNINAFDSLAVKPYSWKLDKAADVAVGLSAALPILCLVDSPSFWKETLIMYAETALFAQGAKESLKALVKRRRPYMYTDSRDGNGTSGNDWANSFPSGHSTMAFAGAAFASYVFCTNTQHKALCIPVVLSCFCVSSTTAILRIASGNHFMTDTIAGAALGAASGVIIPWLHTLKKRHSSNIVLQSLCITTDSISIKLQL